MNTTDPIRFPEVKPPTIKMIVTLSSIAMVSGFLIVLAYSLTLPAILENKRIYLQNAIREILPGTNKVQKFLITRDGSIKTFLENDSKSKDSAEKQAGVRIYKGLDQNGDFKGFVIEASGSGFQDIINIIYAYDPIAQKITGMKVMESKETPGLGDKIETDLDFKKNFIALEVGLNKDRTATAHKIIAVKNGKKTEAWQIDGITGATISSKAIADILQKSTTRVLPMIHKNSAWPGMEFN